MKRSVFIILFIVFFPLNVKANIMCNDGTISPSCTSCHQGCCSHHRGCASGGSSSRSNRSYVTPSYIYGCMDSNSINYNASANRDDGSCIAKKYGCMDLNAVNYDSLANVEDNSCKYKKEIKETEVIKFKTEYKKTDKLYEDEEKTEIEGKNGTKELTYEIIVDKNDVEIERTKLSEQIIENPTNKVVMKGTKPSSDMTIPVLGVYSVAAGGAAVYAVNKNKRKGL